MPSGITVLDSWATKDRPSMLVKIRQPVQEKPILQERPILRPTTAVPRRNSSRSRSGANSVTNSVSSMSPLYRHPRARSAASSRSSNAAVSYRTNHTVSTNPDRFIINASTEKPAGQPALIAIPKSFRPSLQSAYKPFKRGSLSRGTAYSPAADPRRDLEDLFRAVRDGGSPGEVVRSSARKYLSAPFQSNVDQHISGRIGGNRHQVDAVSKLVFSPKRITVGHMPHRLPVPEVTQYTASEAATIIQTQFRGLEARRYCDNKVEWREELKGLMMLVLRCGALGIWFRIWAERRDAAALQIQKAVRMKQAHGEVHQRSLTKQQRSAMVTRLQARARGIATRVMATALNNHRHSKAGIVQAAVRGFLVRSSERRNRLESFLVESGDYEQQKALVRRPSEISLRLPLSTPCADSQELQPIVNRFLNRSMISSDDNKHPKHPNSPKQSAMHMISQHLESAEVAFKYDRVVVQLAAQVRELQTQLQLAKSGQLPDQLEKTAAAEEPSAETARLEDASGNFSKAAVDSGPSEPSIEPIEEKRRNSWFSGAAKRGNSDGAITAVDLPSEQQAGSASIAPQLQQAGNWFSATDAAADAVSDTCPELGSIKTEDGVASTQEPLTGRKRPEWMLVPVEGADLSSIRLPAERVPADAWEAAVDIQSVCRSIANGQDAQRNKKASSVLGRSARLFMVRRRLKLQYSEVEREAFAVAQEHMLELEKVLHMEKFFKQAPNVSVEKWRLAKCIVASKRLVRGLFLHFSSQGISQSAHAFQLSMLQFLSFCTVAHMCRNQDRRMVVFKKIFNASTQNTEQYLPLDVQTCPSHLLLCEFLEALVKLAMVTYPSQRGRVSDSWHEMVNSAVQPLVVSLSAKRIGSPLELMGLKHLKSAGASQYWDALPEQGRQDTAIVYRFFSADLCVDDFDEMNIYEFMKMFESLEQLTEQLTLTAIVHVFIRSNVSEVDHYLTSAISGYKLEERLQMSWLEFQDALFECAQLKFKGTEKSKIEIFREFVDDLSGAWHRYKALQVLQEAQELKQQSWQGTMTNQMSAPLRRGATRIQFEPSALPSTDF